MYRYLAAEHDAIHSYREALASSPQRRTATGDDRGRLGPEVLGTRGATRKKASTGAVSRVSLHSARGKSWARLYSLPTIKVAFGPFSPQEPCDSLPREVPDALPTYLANRHNCMCSWVEAAARESLSIPPWHIRPCWRSSSCVCLLHGRPWPGCQPASQQSVRLFPSPSSCLSLSLSLSDLSPASCLPARPCLRVCVRACARGWPEDPSQVTLTLTLTLSLSLSLPPTITTHQHLYHRPAAALQEPAISPAVPRPRYSGVVWPSCPAGVPRLDLDQAGPLLHAYTHTNYYLTSVYVYMCVCVYVCVWRVHLYVCTSMYPSIWEGGGGAGGGGGMEAQGVDRDPGSGRREPGHGDE